MAKVVCQEGENVKLVIIKNSACSGKCDDGCGGCGESKNVDIMLKSDLQLIEGEIVLLQSNSAYVMAAAFTTYILPLIFMVGAYFMAMNFLENEDTAALIAFVALFIGFVPPVLLNYYQKKKNIFKTVVKKLA